MLSARQLTLELCCGRDGLDASTQGGLPSDADAPTKPYTLFVIRCQVCTARRIPPQYHIRVLCVPYSYSYHIRVLGTYGATLQRPPTHRTRISRPSRLFCVHALNTRTAKLRDRAERMHCASHILGPYVRTYVLSSGLASAMQAPNKEDWEIRKRFRQVHSRHRPRHPFPAPFPLLWA